MSDIEIIYSVLQQIPKGTVATYGQIATLAGKPGGARYIGTLLSKLPKNTQLPWHRVINAKGELSFPLNTQAYNTQRKRLEKESIVFNQNNKVSLKTYQWQP